VQPTNANAGMSPAVLNDYLSRSELAQELNICERTLIRWTAFGEAPPVKKIGRKPMYRRASVAAWLTRLEQCPQQQAGRTA